MRHGTTLLAAVLVCATMTAGAGPADAEQMVTCSSIDGRYNQCQIDTRGGVRLDKQLSRAACRYNDTWGYDRQGIWVRDGCRGRFLVADPGWHDSSSGGWGSSAGDTLTCASEKGRRNYCRANTRGGVRLDRQLSKAACDYGATWGYDRGGIWVDRGCRGVFELDRRQWGNAGSSKPPSGGTLTCSSTDGRRNYCRADTRGGVKLDRQLSKAACRYNDSWGYDSGGVWVRDGCRGVFALRGGHAEAGSRPSGDSDAGKVVAGALLVGAIAAIAANSSDDGKRPVKACQREIENQIQADERYASDLRFERGEASKDGSFQQVYGDGRFDLDGRTERFTFECRVAKGGNVVSARYDR